MQTFTSKHFEVETPYLAAVVKVVLSHVPDHEAAIAPRPLPGGVRHRALEPGVEVCLRPPLQA